MPHHAYLISGAQKTALARAFELHALTEERRTGNPDLHILSYAQFGIDDARELQRWALQSPVREERRVFIVSTESMLHEAQNALLKLFEEPPARSAFVLVVPDAERILPTLRSRFESIVLDGDVSRTSADAFIALDLKDRLKEIATRTKEKDTPWIHALLSSLEERLHEEKNTSALRTVLFVQNYIDRRGASPKMLLEHIALSLP